MPPKARYTKDEIGNAAYQLIRNEGTDALTARSLATALGTSTAPIFTAFSGLNVLFMLWLRMLYLHTFFIRICSADFFSATEISN